MDAKKTGSLGSNTLQTLYKERAKQLG